MLNWQQSKRLAINLKNILQAEKIINGWEYCEKRDCPNLTEILSMINGAPLYQPAQPLPLLHDEDNGDEDDGDGLDNEFGASD